MRIAARYGMLVLALALLGGFSFAKDDDEGKEEKKRKLTKEERKELREKKKQEKLEAAKKRKLAVFGKKLFGQTAQYSTVNKGCNSCHATGGEKDLTGKVTDENEAAARDAMKKCLENRMKMKDDENKLKAWQRNPHNEDALIEYLKCLKPRK